MPEEKTGLHLGCGSKILADMVNLDISPGDGVDLVFDLDSVATNPLPFDDDRFSSFLMEHTLEHLKKPLDVMQELYRVAKPGALFRIAVPHGFHEDAWVDPTHIRPYFPKSFTYFGQPKYEQMDYGYQGDWDISRCELRVSKSTTQSRDRLEILKLAENQMNIVKELYLEMKAIKPARPRDRTLLKNPTIDIRLIK